MAVAVNFMGTHLVIETKGHNDLSAQTKRKALQGWVKAVNALGTWGQWYEALSTHPGDLEWVLGRVADEPRCHQSGSFSSNRQACRGGETWPFS
jgi:hypothetical protein